MVTVANVIPMTTAETDRVYVGAPGPITVKDGASGARMVIERRGFPDAVVWNVSV